MTDSVVRHPTLYPTIFQAFYVAESSISFENPLYEWWVDGFGNVCSLYIVCYSHQKLYGHSICCETVNDSQYTCNSYQDCEK